MVAQIMHAFSQFTLNDIIFGMEWNQVLTWFHMARFAQYDISVPELFVPKYGPEEDVLPQMKKSDSFRDTHYHDPVEGWIKRG